ncbi:S49 family peptidase [Palleronia sp. LCG004]|uniref:S49 family peptidase n=1 Tax=Palleronia sp. LCG004 TaxID=3079304 RepID=UPI0029422CE7|nr:S49 family peptidase [Palleronia sp. LCG004]WOI54965.1 S49 family peptidase [Palleronia sp. LCG004]
MPNDTIGSRLAGQVTALDASTGQGLLGISWPTAEAAMPMAGTLGAVSLQPGERYAIARGVAYVPITGLLTPNYFVLERYLGWATYQGLEQTMAELAANEDVAAVALIMDTPGGLVRGCQAASDAISAVAATKPVHAIAHPLCASAGYHLASQATELVVTPGSEIGSIGVAVMTASFVQPGNSGAQFFELVSSHAMAKRPDASTDAGMAEFRRMLDEAEGVFHAAISRGRNIPTAELPDRLSVNGDPAWGGALYQPEDAVARGVADRVETRAAFDERMLATYAPANVPARRPRRGARAQAAAALAAQGL